MYRINKAQFLGQRFEDETVVVHVESGLYYSLSESGSDILESLEQGLTVEEIAGSFVCNDPGLRLEWQKVVTDFVQQLETEGIIVPTGEVGATTTTIATSAQAKREATSAPLPPVLTRYDDMQLVLLLDPVHLVDPELGWPHR